MYFSNVRMSIESCVGLQKVVSEIRALIQPQPGKFKTVGLTTKRWPQNLCFLAMLTDCMAEKNLFSATSLLFQNCQDFDAIYRWFSARKLQEAFTSVDRRLVSSTEKRRSAEREVARRFQTPARTNTQGLRELGRKFCLCNDICKRLDLLAFSDKNKKSQAPSNSPWRYNKFCCERNHALFTKSKGPSPLWDGLLKFTFTLGGNHNYY